jgi:hypothetical protein
VRLNDLVGDDSLYLVLSNLTQTIVVDNEVTFTNWDGLILSTNFTFQAQTKTNDTDWWIDILDAWGNYVNGGAGHTTNGQIEWTWDLTDTLGYARDDLDSDPSFNSYITFAAVGTGQQTTRPNPAPLPQYPNVGSWLISYSDNFYLEGGSCYAAGHQYYTNGVNGLAGGPAYRNIPVTVFPIKFGTNNYTQAERNNSWVDLKAWLSAPQYRNFYYYGHGSANTIGSDGHNYDTNGCAKAGSFLPHSKSFLTSQTVSNEFTFNRYTGARPYRFVWMDGCSTASGNWPGAFGVSMTTNTVSWYTNSTTNPKHRRPSAFVGWNQTVGGLGWGTAQDAWYFRSQWMFLWMYDWQTKSLVQALEDARQSSSWVQSGQLWGALRVYGYTEMKFDEYNHKNDWRWP